MKRIRGKAIAISIAMTMTVAVVLTERAAAHDFLILHTHEPDESIFLTPLENIAGCTRCQTIPVVGTNGSTVNCTITAYLGPSGGKHLYSLSCESKL